MPPKPFEIYRRLLREGWQDVGGGKGSHRKLKRGDRTIMLPLRRKELPKGLWESIRKTARWRCGVKKRERGRTMRYMYPAIFTENELDGYSVQFVDFENGYTCGDDMEDAVAMAAEVLWLLIDDYLQLDKPLPKPTYPIEHEGLLVALSVDVDTERGVLTTKMAAHLLGVSDARVRQMICSGQLAAKKQGRDNYVYLSSVKERLNNPPKPGRPRKSDRLESVAETAS